MLVIERVSEGGGGEVWRGGLFGLGWTSAGFALSCELGFASSDMGMRMAGNDDDSL